MYILEWFDVEVLFYQKEFENFAKRVREYLPAVRHFLCIDGDGDSGPSLASWAAAQSETPLMSSWDPDRHVYATRHWRYHWPAKRGYEYEP